MGIKKFKPVTPGIRGLRNSDFKDISEKKPYKSLVIGKKKISCRDNYGRTSIRFRGGSHKRKYRKIDFLRTKTGTVIVNSIQYDPNRSSRIALVTGNGNKKSYIIAPLDIKKGDIILNDNEIKIGNCLELSRIPLGTNIHNIEIIPNKGAKLVRSAGNFAKVMSFLEKYTSVKLPSGEIRLINSKCKATIGRIGNIDHDLIKKGKAGRNRWLGKKPHNRGVSMNPVDHPHGGGEGKTSGGRHPCTPWGVSTKGYKTRNNKRTQKFIIKKRK